jgi:uncharacterized protein (DUF58 family)
MSSPLRRELAHAGRQTAAGLARLVRVVVGWLHRAGLTPAGAGLLCLAVVVGIPAWRAGARAALLLVYGAVAVVAIAWLHGRRRLAVDAARSALPERMRAGEVADVTLTLRGRRSSGNLVVEETLPGPLGGPVRVAVPTLAPGRDVRHDYRFVPHVRGVYPVGPLVATWGDPFGLTRRQRVLAEAAEVIVHPVVEPVQDRIFHRQWEDPPIRPPVSKRWPTGFELYGLREYVRGDDPRRIAWRASARALGPKPADDRYFVRESEQGITDQVTLVLDTDAGAHNPGEPSATLEIAVRAVASLADRHLHDGLAITVETNTQRAVNDLRGAPSRLRLLDALARVEPERARLVDVLARLGGRGTRDRHHVVVTPRLDDAAAAQLRTLVERGTPVLVALVASQAADAASRERAVVVGCQLVELDADTAIGAAFRRVVGFGARRSGPVGSGQP